MEFLNRLPKLFSKKNADKIPKGCTINMPKMIAKGIPMKLAKNPNKFVNKFP